MPKPKDSTSSPDRDASRLMTHVRGLGAACAEIADDLLRPPSSAFTKAHRDAVEDEVHANARHSGFYYGLIFCACGIATLGLLQSSAAVVIGAMLISPLMGPIVAMGLSLAELDLPNFRRAATTLGVGVLVSILASVLIVWASPLKEVTSEILARTRPTLLDLIVAALSGVVGGVVTLSQRGGIIAGVAIATALMPPLATVGYGVATGSAAIAGGAGLLFITNVVAILGAVFVVARRYGFKPARHERTRWEAPILALITLLLCAPLALSLNDLVTEARQTNRVRNTIESLFAKEGARINDLRVTVTHGKVVNVQAVVITHGYVDGVEKRFGQTWPDLKGLNIEQVIAANANDINAHKSVGLPSPQLSSPSDALANLPPDRYLNAVLSRVATVQGLKSDNGALSAQVTLKDGGSLAAYRALETAARQLLPGTPVTLIPPSQPLPAIGFAEGKTALDDSGRDAALAAAWAAKRWDAGALQIVGGGPTDRIARARAEAVAQVLDAANVEHAPVAVTVDKTAPDAVNLFVAPAAASASGSAAASGAP
jgi:uncharacterized hydrophobic protein (TIGR00271 family)